MKAEEIKFRVWNGTEMVYDVMVGKFGIFYVNPSNNGIDENDSACLTPANTKYPNDIPVMQYTGLKDKNGIEVYEGDLVRVVSDPDKPIHEVYFDNEMLEFGLRNSFELFYCQFGYNFEVIGNIHDKTQQKQTLIDKVTTRHLEIALRLAGIYIDKSILDRVIDMVELLEDKGGSATIFDIVDLKKKWREKNGN